MKKILIVEDDILAAELEKDYLEADDFTVTVSTNGKDGLSLAQNECFDLILLDVMLPGMSGFSVCKEIRKTMNTPIIMVTARKEDIDKIQGLGLGADDYVTKPFSPGELVARVKAHIAVHERLMGSYQSTKILEFGSLIINTDSHIVTVDGQKIDLKRKEYELLYYLASNPNTLFSKEELFEKIWGMEHIGTTATVTVHINRIREKIEKAPSQPQYILTVWGSGYKFCADIGGGDL